MRTNILLKTIAFVILTAIQTIAFLRVPSSSLLMEPMVMIKTPEQKNNH